MKNHPDFILETKNYLTIELLRVWRDQLKFLIKFDCILWDSYIIDPQSSGEILLANVKGSMNIGFLSLHL